MIDLHKGKLCCSRCHHLISIEGEAKENCPYCKKKLTWEEREHWAREEKAQEVRDRKFYATLEPDLSERYWGISVLRLMKKRKANPSSKT